MPADAFAAEVDRLWGQVKPLYDALHCYVRARLAQTYGDAVVPAGQPIPAHLLGNMWAQNWSGLYDLAAPAEADRGFDLGRALLDKGVQPRDMVRNFNLMSVAQKVDEWSYREIRNQNDLFAQPMLVRVRTAMDGERHLADASSDRLLLWASGAPSTQR